MRLLYVPPSSSNPLTDGLYKAFNKRCTVDHFWLQGTRGRPDLAYVQSGAVSIELLKDMSDVCKVFQWAGDYRPEGIDHVRTYMQYCYKTFCAADVPELYPGMIWLPHAVDYWQFRQVNEDAKGMVMIANDHSQFPGGKERQDLAEILKGRGDFTGYGSGFESSLDWMKGPDVYNKSRFGIGGNIYNDARLYFSNRPLNAMAAGTCYIMRYVPGLEEVFTDGVHCLFWRTFQEALSHLTISDKIRNAIARDGQKKVRSEFMYDNFADKILSYV